MTRSTYLAECFLDDVRQGLSSSDGPVPGGGKKRKDRRGIDAMLAMVEQQLEMAENYDV